MSGRPRLLYSNGKELVRAEDVAPRQQHAEKFLYCRKKKNPTENFSPDPEKLTRLPRLASPLPADLFPCVYSQCDFENKRRTQTKVHVSLLTRTLAEKMQLLTNGIINICIYNIDVNKR